MAMSTMLTTTSKVDLTVHQGILERLQQQQLLIVNPRRRNGLILYKFYHAEFAGPGSIVGGIGDLDCRAVLPVGDLDLLVPAAVDDRQRGYLTRRQWIQLTRRITEQEQPEQRAKMILEQFEHYFDAKAIAKIPDDAFSLLVGVLPRTIKNIRES